MNAPGFTGGRLDRADRIRHEPDLLAAALADPKARLLRLDGLDPVVDAEGRLGWTALADAPEGAERLFLGFEDGVPHFAARLPDASPAAGRSPQLMTLLGTLRRDEAAHYAAARSLIEWHARHGFCSFCGASSAPHRAGWGRLCPACGTEHFPRVDPVVIMIAERDGHALLGRQPGWPPGRYSALAGFLEVGETIEEAVAREVAEEAGIAVGAVRYLASQPWPFPSSLMIACIAQATTDAITIDRHELEDARWFGRAEVAAALAGAGDAPFLPPPRYAIAHTLLTAWACA